MQFHSFQYLMFLPSVILLYFIFPHRFRWFILLFSSYYFYAAWRIDFVFFLLISTITDFIAGLCLERTEKKNYRKLILAFSLAVNLGLLLFFKYLSTIWDGIGWGINTFLPDSSIQLSHLDIILPLGISFYTFQTLSYTIDVYRKRISAERHFGYFALYVTFFPQLLAGPIERASHLITQLRAAQVFQWSWCGSAFFLITLGLAKKTVIADRINQVFSPVISQPESYGAFILLLTPVARVYQYYCDLSGYADIAMGSALLLGIQLSKNFDRPFAATSTIRFWYRWHITVTWWFRDYLMRCFTGGGSIARVRPVALIITGLVIGLWHSPSLGWLIAGLSVSLLAIPEIAWTHWRIRRRIRPRNGLETFFWNWFGRFYVWFVVFYLIGIPLTWESFEELSVIVAKLATIDSSVFFTLDGISLNILILLLIFVLLLEVWQWMEAKGYAKRILVALPLELRWLAGALFVMFVMVFAVVSNNGFLYFGY